jgi:hypothetical protein
MQLEDDTTYTPSYAENPKVELLVLGAVSLCPTFINIVGVFLAGIIILKVSLHTLIAENLVQIYVTYQDH